MNPTVKILIFKNKGEIGIHDLNLAFPANSGYVEVVDIKDPNLRVFTMHGKNAMQWNSVASEALKVLGHTKAIYGPMLLAGRDGDSVKDTPPETVAFLRRAMPTKKWPPEPAVLLENSRVETRELAPVHEISFIPAFDFRNDSDEDKRRQGQHGMDMLFRTANWWATVELRVSTHWQVTPDNKITLAVPFPPDPCSLVLHADSPKEGLVHRGACPIRSGSQCYYKQLSPSIELPGFLITLVAEGEKTFWEVLDQMLADETAR